MRFSARVTVCVDCSTPIIGVSADDEVRCAACRKQDDARRVKRQVHAMQAANTLTLWQALIAWLVAAQLLAVIVIALIMAVRSCG